MSTNFNQFDLQPIESVGYKIIHMLNRPAVFYQVLAIVICIGFSWGVNYSVWRYIQVKVPHINTLLTAQHHRSLITKFLRGNYFLLSPLLLCGSLLVTHLIFRFFSQFHGLIENAFLLSIGFVGYRLFLYFGSFIVSFKAIKYYRNHLFTPLLLYFLIANTLQLIDDYQQFVKTPLVTLFGTSISLGKIFLSTGGIYCWIVATSLIEKMVIYLFQTKTNKDFEFIVATSVIVRYGLIGLGVVVIFSYVGVNSAVLTTITGGLSVGIGFGLKEVISNFVSGIWLFIEGSLKPGDVVNVSGDLSKVVSLGFRAATVNVIRDNSERIIPNQLFFTEEVNTYTGSNPLLYSSITVGAAYHCNPKQVLAVLYWVARQHPDVLRSPEPKVFFLGFGDSSLDFELKFWLDDPLIRKRVNSELGCDIWEAFADADIEIPFPQRDLHLRSGWSPSTVDS